MNPVIASPASASVIIPATDDQFDRSYRFGQPLTYLSDRQQARVLIMRGRVNDARSEPQTA